VFDVGCRDYAKSVFTDPGEGEAFGDIAAAKVVKP
jgi:hypothetical protein